MRRRFRFTVVTLLADYIFLSLLNEKEYAVSDGLLASSEDIFQIFKMMRYVKATN